MTDRVMLVTGGGRGIGAAVCRRAAAAGYRVAVNYRSDAAAAEALVAELRAAGAEADAFAADMADEAGVAALFEWLDARFGRLTHFVCNAGFTGRVGRFDEADPAMLRAVMDLNVTGAMLSLQAALRRISTRHGGPGGAIVNVSSAAARLGSPGEFVWYAASKGAMDSLTLGLAREVAREGVRVNAVSPGMIDTEIHAAAGDPDRASRAAASLPNGRVGTADEVASAIMYLLSDEASYVNGANITISGGR